MESDCQQFLDCTNDYQQLEQNDLQQHLETNQSILETKNNDEKNVSVLQFEVSEDQIEYPQIGKLIFHI